LTWTLAPFFSFLFPYITDPLQISTLVLGDLFIFMNTFLMGDHWMAWMSLFLALIELAQW
jgi:hypothetical protein